MKSSLYQVTFHKEMSALYMEKTHHIYFIEKHTLSGEQKKGKGAVKKHSSSTSQSKSEICVFLTKYMVSVFPQRFFLMFFFDGISLHLH